MKKKGVIIGVIIAVIVIIAVSIIGSYNGLISLEESTNTAYSDIQVQLQRRMDLVPNLVNTVKGYAAHETEVFTAVSDARAKLAGAGTVEEASEANEELSSALSRLIAISESYPELKSNENFLSLQDELAGTENRIGVARKDYNAAKRIFPLLISIKTYRRSRLCRTVCLKLLFLFKTKHICKYVCRE